MKKNIGFDEERNTLTVESEFLSIGDVFLLKAIAEKLMLEYHMDYLERNPKLVYDKYIECIEAQNDSIL